MLISRVAVPEGVLPPIVIVISDTSVRVSWQAPIKPNGPITAYLIHIDEDIIDPHTASPSSYVIDGLQPYTVYDIQVSLPLCLCLCISLSLYLLFTYFMDVTDVRCRNKSCRRKSSKKNFKATRHDDTQA